MIPKLTTGNGFGGSIRYDTRQGREMKPGLAKVLDVSGVEFDIDKDGNYIIDTKQVARDFRAQTMGYQGDREIRKPVYHWVLSYHPDDKVSEEQMVEDAKEFLKRIGFDDTQYVMTVHYDKEHHHLHIVTNVVNNQGKRISTMGLIDKAHEAAAAITKERGYIWGKKTQKQSITAEKIHDPHDRARKIIEPIIREAKDKATSLDEFKQLLESQGISCIITVAKDRKRGGISYACKYEDQEHTFKGSSVARDLSFGYVSNAIKANQKHQKEVYNELSTEYAAIIPPIAKELLTVNNHCYLLYKEATEAKVAVKTETTEKYNELKSAWAQFKDLNETRNNERDIVKATEAIGGMLMLLNPIVGLFVIFLAKITDDVRQSSHLEQKKQLLRKIESVRNEITDLVDKKEQLNIQRSERLNAYLDAKKCYQEYKGGLQKLDETIHDIRIEALKQEFPFRDKGHIQYIIHGRHDASIFRAEEDEGIYRRMPTGKFQGAEKKYEIMEDYYEKAREALKERVMFVAGSRGPKSFYDTLLAEQKNGDYRVGDMQIHPDGKITFGQEQIFGDPKMTEYYMPKKEESVRQTVQVNEAPVPAQASAPAPQPKPSFEIVRTFTCDYYNFRIKKEGDGIYKLQQLKPDPNSPVIDHKYSKQAWFTNAKFTSFQEIAKDNDWIYFKIKDLEGKTRYINQYGTDLSIKVKARLGLGGGKGTGGVSMH